MHKHLQTLILSMYVIIIYLLIFLLDEKGISGFFFAPRTCWGRSKNVRSAENILRILLHTTG